MCEMKSFHLVHSFNLDEYVVGIHPRESDLVQAEDSHNFRHSHATTTKSSKEGSEERWKETTITFITTQKFPMRGIFVLYAWGFVSTLVIATLFGFKIVKLSYPQLLFSRTALRLMR